jgi:Acetyltransferases
MDVVAYTMAYEGKSVCSELTPIPFSEKYYNEYRDIYHDCFYEMRKALNLQPYNACDSIDQLSAKKDDIFLLIIDNEMIGSVAVCGNEIDDLIVAHKFQNQGYGKQLLEFAIALLQTRKADSITLGVAEWNQKAISLYKNNGFIISKIETVRV